MRRRSEVLLLLLVPSLTFSQSRLGSNRLKPLEKSDWRAIFSTSVSYLKKRKHEVTFFCGGENLDMSSVCDKLDFKDAESHLVSSFASNPINCCNGSKGISFVGSQDAHESEGDDSGYINECVK